MDVITCLADLRPGDLLFAPIGGLFPGVFPVAVGQLMLGEAFRVGQLSIRHVAMIVEAGDRPRLVQAMPGGAEEIVIDQRWWTPRHAYVRLPEDRPGQAQDAADIARLFVAMGVSYSTASYAMLSAWRAGIKTPHLAAHIDRRRPEPITDLAPHLAGRIPDGGRLPREAICSVLADQAWTLAGKRVMRDTPSQVVTPGAMATQLWRRPNAVWGGAGLSAA